MKNVSDHAHPMHKGPHHSKYVHSDNMQNDNCCKGSHELGDSSHLSSVMGSPSGRDVAGHSGNMSKGK